MPQIIAIPGVGEVEFPDGMSDEAISSAIRSMTTGSGTQAKAPAQMGDLRASEHERSLVTADNVPAALLTGDPNADRQIAASLAAGGHTKKITPQAANRALLISASLLAPEALALGPAAGGALGGALFGAGTSPADDVSGMAADAAKGGAIGAGTGVLLPIAVRAGRVVAGKAATALGDLAETAAVRSAYADRTALRAAGMGKGQPYAAEKLHALGRWLLESGVPLRSPQAMKEGLHGVLQQEGPQVGALAQQADQAGARVNLATLRDRALTSGDIANLSKNTETRPAVERLRAFLDDQIAQHGEQIPATVAHDIRQQLDPLSKWTKADPRSLQPVAEGFRALRSEVSSDLGSALEGAGLGDQWAAANRSYSHARRAYGLAETGAERRAGNMMLTLPEKVVAGGGALGAALSHDPRALALLPLTVGVQRYGMPITARVADSLSKAIAPRAAVPAPDMAPELTAALIAALRGKSGRLPGPTFGLTPAAADQEGK